MRDVLSATQKRGAYLFARNLTESVGYFAIAEETRKVRDTFEGKADSYSLHGLRKTAAVQLAEAGCSDAEIQFVTGHKSLAMVQHYRKRAAQKRLSKTAQIRREQNIDET